MPVLGDGKLGMYADVLLLAHHLSVELQVAMQTARS